MPEKLSNNNHGKKQAGTMARLLFIGPFQGMNAQMITDSAITMTDVSASALHPAHRQAAP
jgi:hypothetical protein